MKKHIDIPKAALIMGNSNNKLKFQIQFDSQASWTPLAGVISGTYVEARRVEEKKLAIDRKIIFTGKKKK